MKFLLQVVENNEGKFLVSCDDCEGNHVNGEFKDKNKAMGLAWTWATGQDEELQRIYTEIYRKSEDEQTPNS